MIKKYNLIILIVVYSILQVLYSTCYTIVHIRYLYTVQYITLLHAVVWLNVPPTALSDWLEVTSDSQSTQSHCVTDRQTQSCTGEQSREELCRSAACRSS